MMEMTYTDQPTITKKQAETLDAKIRRAFDQMEVWSGEVWELATQMRDCLGYKHFGFDAWADYLAARVEGYHHVKASRGMLCVELALAGNSNYEIGRKLGVSEKTVRRELSEQPIQARQNAAVNNRPKCQERIKQLSKEGHSQLEIARKLHIGQATVSRVLNPKAKQPKPVEPKVDPQARLQPRSEFWACVAEGWSGAFRMFKDGARNLTNNPSYAQLDELERYLNGLLRKVRNMKSLMESVA